MEGVPGESPSRELKSWYCAAGEDEGEGEEATEELLPMPKRLSALVAEHGALWAAHLTPRLRLRLLASHTDGGAVARDEAWRVVRLARTPLWT